MDIKDLFISYKRVDAPKTTVPIYTPEVSINEMIASQNMATKVDNLKARISESPTLKWISGGNKEEPYSTTPSIPAKEALIKEPPVQQVPQKALTIKGDKNNWKAELYAAYKRNGCSDQFARNLIGQDALETGWGQHIVGDYNYGNIKTGKSWTGASRKAHDKVENSYDAYRSYESVDDYVKDKLELLKGRYHITGTETPEQFTDKLVAGGYATGKDYKYRVLNTIKSV